jgi:hypothetical protein
MIDHLPEGKSIGWMQAPPNWILTHTVRFVGIVRVVIQDGEGFILINKGKPLTYYFKHGRIELRGHAALDYFNSHPIIEFNLSKYTPDELAEAMKICNVDEPEPVVLPRDEQKIPEITDLFEPEPVIQPLVPEGTAPGAPSIEPVMEMQPPAPVPVIEKPSGKSVVSISAGQIPPSPPVLTQNIHSQTSPAVPLAPVVLDETAIRIIGQIKELNGIVAISVFSEERNIILRGDVEIEPLLKVARNMLETTRKISPNLEWGSFVHMTLQIPEGNVIIAPYHEYHLCLLTTRTINIGHIRRILRDIQTDYA